MNSALGVVRYAYVCTNFNNSEYTIEAVKSLEEGEIRPEVIVIVDNASSTDSVALLRRELEGRAGVKLLLLKENLGYFAGLNAGVRALGELSKALDCVVVGNNDLVFPADFGVRLRERAGVLKECPVVSPNVITVDGVHQNPHVITPVSRVREIVYDIYYSNYYAALAIGKLAQWTRRFSDRSDETHHDKPMFIHQGHGSCYLLTRLFFERFGELWAPTFLMGEEYFLAKQLEDAGYSVFYEPTISVRHHWHATLGKLPGRRSWGFARDAHKVYRRYVNPWRL